ncbi:MAG: tight adherence protein [Chloroflexota bacterium]|nr:tight adherence protein [Chloroflexota bacterium]
MSGQLLLFFAIIAAAGAFVAIAAVALPATEGEGSMSAVPGTLPLRGARSLPTGFRDRIDRSFQGVVERGNRRRLKHTGLTLAEHLARADLKLRSSEFVLIQLGCLVAFALVGLIRFGFGPQFVVSAVGGYLIPMRVVKFRQAKRLKKFNSQLPETLGLLSNGLKAGYSLPQALDSVARNTTAPISEELGRVTREMSVGASLDQSLLNMVKRVASDDLDLIVTAVLIHRSVGGNLAQVLDNISHTVRQRVMVKGQIAALTAQARASGWIITLLPVAVAALLYVIAPTYFRSLTTDRLGIAMLVLAAVMIFIGNLIIRRITSIRV